MNLLQPPITTPSNQIDSETYRSGSEYIESLWRNGPSKLLFIRVDLGFDQASQSSIHFAQAQELFKKLRNNQRSKPSIFENYKGIIWRMEWTLDKSYHYHCLYVFDGTKIQNGIYYANAIGEYWRNSITKGIGTWWNCNAQEQHYQKCGIGLIDHRDMEKRENLLTQVLPYLTKPDNHIRGAIRQDALALEYPDAGNHARTFGTSNKLSPRTSNVGRPRIQQW